METLQALKNIDDQYNFIPSFLSGEPASAKYYFQCHIPKCAGMDFSQSLQFSLAFIAKARGLRCMAGRTSWDPNNPDKLNGIKDRVAGTLAKNSFVILSSHSGFEVLDRVCPENASPITFLRDPLLRSLSHYSYDCMRSSKLPSVDEYSLFVQDPLNQNVLCRSFTKQIALDKLVARIESTFEICADVTHVDSSLSALVSRHHAPSIVKRKINSTLPQYKLTLDDVSDEIQQKFLELNRADFEFYQHFKENPVLLTSDQTGPINRHTVLIREKQSEAGMSAECKLLDIEDVLQEVSSYQGAVQA